nr:MAG TPA: hypothetical protein [Caudoviricetes sp.]
MCFSFLRMANTRLGFALPFLWNDDFRGLARCLIFKETDK